MPTLIERRKLDGERRRSEWNAKHPPGTRVRYYPVAGERDAVEQLLFLDTTTRSEAWCLGHGEPVVMIVGRSGGVALSHLVVLGDDGRAA